VWSTPFVAEITEVTRTRNEAAAHLRTQEVPEAQVADALLMLSELVTNAVYHGVQPLALRVVLSSGRIRVEVDDASTEPPVLRPIDPHRLGGMGMRIVDDLSDEWGCTATEVGKTVWFELAVAGRPAPAVDGRQTTA
jgi:anti-sigma regulatory factor (Ser/Thr protein kinase)